MPGAPSNAEVGAAAAAAAASQVWFTDTDGRRMQLAEEGSARATTASGPPVSRGAAAAAAAASPRASSPLLDNSVSSPSATSAAGRAAAADEPEAEGSAARAVSPGLRHRRPKEHAAQIAARRAKEAKRKERIATHSIASHTVTMREHGTADLPSAGAAPAAAAAAAAPAVSEAIVMNNYVGFGVDAAVTLQFDMLRRQHPGVFSTRTGELYLAPAPAPAAVLLHQPARREQDVLPSARRQGDACPILRLGY
eukprot:SAG11_NODE_613_length_8205_cov_28.925487_12_plen_252_part_00